MSEANRDDRGDDRAYYAAFPTARAYPLNTRDMRVTVPVDEVWFVPPLEQRVGESDRDFVRRVAAATVRIVNVKLDEG